MKKADRRRLGGLLSGQVSDSIPIGVLLTFVGGYLDAYTYISRGGVFANAQTGNVVLLGLNLAGGQWLHALEYLVPIFSFVLGVYIAEELQWHLKWKQAVHWRQIVLLIEVLILAVVSFLPHSVNELANSAVSFVCALQVDSFRKIRGHSLATTMCTGNLRIATEMVSIYRHSREPRLLKKGLVYYGSILIFILGALVGKLFTDWLDIRAALLCCALLLVGFALMFIREEEKQTENNPQT